MNWQEPLGNVLIVDDNPEFQHAASDLARLSKCVPFPAATLQEARRLTRDESFDLILIDLNLPDGNGLDLLDDIDLTAHGQIVIVTGHPTVESAVRAVATPVVEYLVKPLGPGVLTSLLDRAHLRAQLRQTEQTDGLGDMIGQSAPMHELFAQIRRVAPLDVNVLVHGESGTGKELVARALHDLSGRRGRFVAATTRTSSGISCVPPIRVNECPSKARSRYTCSASGISLISSRNNVPPSDCSK